MISAPILLQIAPNLGIKAGPYADILNAAMDRFSITTPNQIAHFIAETAIESGHFQDFRENLNYSAAGLLKTWPTRFKNLVDAQFYERQPAKIANFVYANRMGNGDEKSGDGWRFRGAGWIMLTGRSNQQTVAQALGITGDIGDWLSTPSGAALSAAWFWWSHGCNRLADQNNVDAVADIVNLGRRTQRIGDAIGYLDRQHATNTMMRLLA